MTQEKTRRPAKPKAAGAPAATTAARARPAVARAAKPSAAKPAAKKAASAVGKASARRAAAAAKPARVAKRPALVDLVVAALEDLKAQNVTVLDVRELTTVADTIVIASGTSDRHVKSLAGNVSSKAAEAGFRALGREGERDGEWVLVDLSDVIVHVMLPRVREFYGLEKLWDVRAGGRSTDG